jgi:hypothetical protein
MKAGKYRIIIGLAVVALLTTFSLPAAAGGNASPNTPKATAEDCFAEFETGTGADISCAWPVVLSVEERAELKKASREYLEDVSCQVTVKIARKMVSDALVAKDLVFEAPPQPVTCDLKTYKGVRKISATFAPRVVFKNGEAVEGTPGLGNVTGVTKVLSWPVVQFVNRWPGVKRDMVKIINAYRAHHAKKLSAGTR